MLDRGSAISQQFLLPLGPLRSHTQLLMVECPIRQINMLQYLVGFWLDLKLRI